MITAANSIEIHAVFLRASGRNIWNGTDRQKTGQMPLRTSTRQKHNA